MQKPAEMPQIVDGYQLPQNLQTWWKYCRQETHTPYSSTL